MKSWKLFPENTQVAKYVECYWFLEKEHGDESDNYPKLYPDPSAHLIIANINDVYQYDQESVSQQGSGSYWIFPHRKTFVMDHSTSFIIIGVKFKIGALYALNLHTLNSNTIQFELDKIVPVNIQSLLDIESFNTENLFLQGRNNGQGLCSTLDKIILPWLLTSQEDKQSELVRNILPLLKDTPISQIGSVLHRSQRTVERNFLSVTALTLKQCHSMLRFEEMLEHLYKLEGEPINWANFSATFGFSDQPHLIRHIKSFIGSTPGEYIRQRDLTIDIYGNFEF